MIAANTGYRPGWVHFSARSATGINLVDYLREKAPSGADEAYGSGHAQATGGALKTAQWNEFVAGLGFGPDMQHVRRRLVLEHDDLRFSAADVLWIHEHTGVRLIFDYQHFWCLNPERLDMRDALRAILRTWPDGVRPKIHFSSPRTELRELARKNRKTGKQEKIYAAPVWTGHADFGNPFEFATFMRAASGLEFDVMLEAKAKDLAVIRLRPDMLRYADDVAARFGLYPAEAERLESEEAALLEEQDEAGA